MHRRGFLLGAATTAVAIGMHQAWQAGRSTLAQAPAGPPAAGLEPLPVSASASAPVPVPVPVPAEPARRGHLVVAGGAEDRDGDKAILRRFAELADAQDPRIVVITAASAYPEEMWSIYRRAFGELGVARCEPLAIDSRERADDPEIADVLLEADGVFMTGGDQARLVTLLGGTAAHRALHRAFHEQGACVGGTSAGAAAMALHMLAEGRTPALAEKGAARLDTGLALLPPAIVDQHFAERRRLGRLMSAVAQRPGLLGIGIDEDTALVIDSGRGLEVIGEGSVTLIDGRHIRSNYARAAAPKRLSLLSLGLHLLPSGTHYELPAFAHASAAAGSMSDAADDDTTPAALREAVAMLVTAQPALAAPVLGTPPEGAPAPAAPAGGARAASAPACQERAPAG